MTKRRRRPSQLDFHDLPGWGGRRAGAGRPPVGERAGVSHEVRPPLPHAHPVHVTIRIVDGLPSLRTRECWQKIRQAIAGGQKGSFRICEFSVQDNHLHLVVEARHGPALSRGMQGLQVRLARAINRAVGREGTVFADRYHAHPLKTPREVHHALSYVLNNRRKHLAGTGRAQLASGTVDPYSSALYFEDWSTTPEADPELTGPRVTVPPRTWLLRHGWRRHGRLDIDAIPGAAPWSRRSRAA